MPLFKTWQKINTVSISTVCAWRGLIPLGHTREVLQSDSQTPATDVAAQILPKPGKKPRETPSVFFIQELTLACKVSYRGPCCTEPQQLVKLRTEQSHITQPLGAMSHSAQIIQEPLDTCSLLLWQRPPAALRDWQY